MWRAPPPIDRQHGAALLVFMLIFFLASTSWLLAQANSSRMRSEADKVTSAALAQAKDALIGRAAADNNRPGSLPCPNFDDNNTPGEAATSCVAGAIGRLPWKTLDIPDFRDGEGNRLWYALAPELRDSGSPAIINPTLELGLTLDGKTNIAAIIFSAGPPLSEQNGRPSNIVTDYLDGANASGGPYVSGPSSSTFNDRLVAITRDQLFTVVNRRILGRLRVVLRNYYAKNAKYPETIGTTTLTQEYFGTQLKDKTEREAIEENGWYGFTTYASTSDKATITVGLSPETTSCTFTQTQNSCTNP